MEHKCRSRSTKIPFQAPIVLGGVAATHPEKNAGQCEHVDIRLKAIKFDHSHRAATNPVMAAIRLVTTPSAGSEIEAADVPMGAGAGACTWPSCARATPTVDTATAAIKTLAAADRMVEAICRPVNELEVKM